VIHLDDMWWWSAQNCPTLVLLFSSFCFRFYDVDEGSVTISGVDIRELDPSWLRGNCIGFINQEPVLFATSIMENIRYGKPSASDSEVLSFSYHTSLLLCCRLSVITCYNNQVWGVMLACYVHVTLDFINCIVLCVRTVQLFFYSLWNSFIAFPKLKLHVSCEHVVMNKDCLARVLFNTVFIHATVRTWSSSYSSLWEPKSLLSTYTVFVQEYCI
jgi:hypothetical protein